MVFYEKNILGNYSRVYSEATHIADIFSENQPTQSFGKNDQFPLGHVHQIRL